MSLYIEAGTACSSQATRKAASKRSLAPAETGTFSCFCCSCVTCVMFVLTFCAHCVSICM